MMSRLLVDMKPLPEACDPGGQSGPGRSIRQVFGSHPLDKTIDHLLLAGFFERDGELVAVDLRHLAVAEFLGKDAIAERELGSCAGGFRDQFALDGHGGALVAGKAAGVAPRGKRRLAFVEAAAGLSVAAALAALAVGLGALPARRRIAGAERLHIVEARRAIAATAAPARAALGFGNLDIRRRQFVEEARWNRGRPGAVNSPVGGEVKLGAAAGAGQPDMGEAALFLEAGAALFVQGALARKQAFLPAGQEHIVEFQSLG